MIYEGNNGAFHVGGRAVLLDRDDAPATAWAERHVRKDPDIKWILGNYVEGGNANLNGHIFPTADLEPSLLSLQHKPLNMLHHHEYIVGNFAGAEVVPGDGADAKAAERPVMEALAAFYKTIFPKEYTKVEAAHADGSLFYSMEAWPAKIECPECGHEDTWKGKQHEDYCGHMNASPVSQKILHKPRWLGGAIIIPPVKPGWDRADITALAGLMKSSADAAEALHDDIARTLPDADPRQWEALMGMIMLGHEVGGR